MGKTNKFLLFIFIATITIISIHFVIDAEQTSTEYDPVINQPPLIGEGIYQSNRYTQPENYDAVNLFNNTFTSSDQKVAENSRFSLYVNEKTAIFKVEDKTKVDDKNYVWSSAISQLGSRDSTLISSNWLLSSFVVEYYNIDMNTKEPSEVISKLFLTDAEKGMQYFNPDMADNVEIDYQSIENGIEITITYTVDYQVYADNGKDIVDMQDTLSFKAEVTLNDKGLKVHIPNDSLIENKIKFAAIYVMPFLGATRLDDTPGYMFVPDGTGALVRYRDNGRDKMKQKVFNYYGKDEGLIDYTLLNQPYKTIDDSLTMPIFGGVHGIKQNAFLGVIEQGDMNAELLLNENGVLYTKYNWITPRFILRSKFNLYGVNTSLNKYINPEDITINYMFLANDDADYVGMAKTYQKYLVDKGDLTKNIDQSVPLRLEVLASDSTSGLLGPKVQTMTTVNQTRDIVTELRNNNINDLLLVMRGWNTGGMSGNSPYPMNYEDSVGSIGEFKNMINDFQDLSIPVYFYNDYVIGYDGSSRINKRADIARSLRRIQFSFDLPNKPVYTNYYYLNPSSSYEIARDDIDSYQGLNINHLALDSIGNTLFSYYKDRKEYARINTANHYENLLSDLGENNQLSLYKPNAYLWKYTKNYFDIPMYNTQYTYYTDSVPFIQLVLKGYINYYAPFSNFFASTKQQLLYLIDYGMYPSFIITNDSTYELKYTNANNYFSTKYGDLKQDIIDTYQLINENLQSVVNATIVSREVIATGVVKVTYSNNISFVINYTVNDYEYEDQIVPAIDFIKIGVE